MNAHVIVQGTCHICYTYNYLIYTFAYCGYTYSWKAIRCTFFQQLFVGSLNLALPILSSVTCKSISQAPRRIQAESKHRITCNRPRAVTSHAQRQLHFNSCYSDQDNIDRIEKSTTMPPPTRPATKPSPSTTTTPTAATRPRSPETHASLAARNEAAEILQSYEQLSWHALSRNEVRPSPEPNLARSSSNHLAFSSF